MNHSTLIACIWDFDKTLIPGFMQEPLFKAFDLDAKQFWREVNALSEVYAKRNVGVSEDLMYLNHLLTYVKSGWLRGLNNKKLRELGAELPLFDGLPEFFQTLKNFVKEDAVFQKHHIQLEHYVISCGLAEMVRGSKIASYVDGIFGCEFIEEPMLPGFLTQQTMPLEVNEHEISQIGRVVDNTTKTRYLFEINKGVNKDPRVNVNASMPREERRIPMENMIYIADGSSDIPMFAIMKEHGGKTFAVYHPNSMQEFMQNDILLANGRVDCYGPADYLPGSSTYRWITMHVRKIAEKIVTQREQSLQAKLINPPEHRNKDEDLVSIQKQPDLFSTHF